MLYQPQSWFLRLASAAPPIAPAATPAPPAMYAARLRVTCALAALPAAWTFRLACPAASLASLTFLAARSLIVFGAFAAVLSAIVLVGVALVGVAGADVFAFALGIIILM